MWEAESHTRLQEQTPLIAEARSSVQVFVDILESGSINTSTTAPGKDSSEHEIFTTSMPNSSFATEPSLAPSASSTSSLPSTPPKPTPFQVTLPPVSSSLVEVISSIASIMSHETPFATTLTQSEHPPTRAPESQPSSSPSSLSTQHGSTVSTAPQHSSVVHTSTHSPMPSGESIFGTIMNRLTVLEANHTLYAQYVEAQTAGVREVLRKLGEEVGRLESIVSATLLRLVMVVADNCF